ncbi:hypothetical protein [uncultured Roseibium sp.]|uniref:hypothetical protein n=1 Tax=uncultured Roseibium sp. TaxID=1936171 RepID=UPI0032170322
MNPSQFAAPLMILALISAVLNFAGFSSIVGGDWWHLSLCALTSVGVFVALYMFWKVAFDVLPTLDNPVIRAIGWVTVASGIAIVLSISAYWNLVALAQSEVQLLALKDRTVQAETRLNEAIGEGGKFKGLSGQLTAFAANIESLAASEEQSGAISGSPGKGAVSKLLRQITAKIDARASMVAKAGDDVSALGADGQLCLGNLRGTLENGGTDLEQKAAGSVDCVNAVIAGLGSQSVADQVRQDMAALTAGIVIPASVRTKAQKEAIGNILAGVQEQANAIADTAAGLVSRTVETVSNSRPNAMLGVLVYWRSLIPAIATAVAIDLLPLVLLAFLMLRVRDLNRQGKPTSTTTLGEVERIHDELNRLDRKRGAPLRIGGGQ